MNDDAFDAIIDEFDECNAGFIGTPHNESRKAIIAMLQEHAIDYECTSKWLVGILLIAVDKLGESVAPIEEQLEVARSLSSSDMAIIGFEAVNTLMSKAQNGGKRGRRSQR